MTYRVSFIITGLVISASLIQASFNKRYECINGECNVIKDNTNIDAQQVISKQACYLLCSPLSNLWPIPTGVYNIAPSLSRINIDTITFNVNSNDANLLDLLEKGADRFKNIIQSYGTESYKENVIKKTVNVKLLLKNFSVNKVVYGQNESYELNISGKSDIVNVNIKADNFFGARHGMETLSQLIIFDDIRNEFQIADSVYISDGPKYLHRGLLLDTARNYFSINTIKRTIDAMAMNKLNVFHWHMIDTHSFPFVSENFPEMSILGAYSASQVYTHEAIRDVIEYAKVRGVMVLAEFDAPAHVGEGWQHTKDLVCFNEKNWTAYCQEPPCGQLNPISKTVYDRLEILYEEFIKLFIPDVFHMGGDEVSKECWLENEEIKEYISKHNIDASTAYYYLWELFQKNAYARFMKHIKTKIPVIVWSSSLTESDDLETVLPKDDYVIQFWHQTPSFKINSILKKGYKIIISNYNALYMDCGFSAWVNDGLNWCSPYIPWQKVYMNNISNVAGNYSSQVLGSEIAMWTEQVDENHIDDRLWPRAAAFAERIWSDPHLNWKDAHDRLVMQRERLALNNIKAEALEPEWCRQHQGACWKN